MILDDMAALMKKGSDGSGGSSNTADLFNSSMRDVKFQVYGSDAKAVELIAGGAKTAVTWENKSKFCEALTRYRLNEFRVQCEAIRRGLATVIPYKQLPLLTWQELEYMVCGSRRVDVDLLESMTSYFDCVSSDRHIRLFWRMMRERFDDDMRAKFLSFVWGRSTMPTKIDPVIRFKIQRYNRSAIADNAFPIGHTCFFSIELPPYSSLDIMTQKVTYAIVNCSAIDGDSARAHMFISTDIGNDNDPAHASLFQ